MNIIDLLNRDVKYDNESKKAMVSLRLLYIIVLAAIVVNILWTSGAVFNYFGVQLVVIIIVGVLLFIQTFFARTRLALAGFNVFIAASIFILIPCFGWHAGIQNYLLILVMLFFFATHVKLGTKVIYSVFVFLYRVMLTLVFGESTSSVVQITVPEYCLEITNIAAVFVSVILFSYMYSKESTEAEDKLIKYNEKLETAANTDPLTGLFNRRFTYDILQEMSDSDEYTCISIAMGDIDFFKDVNDTYGHDAGDEVLKAVAKVMTEESGGKSIVARWGGEEFLIIFPGINGDDAFAILRKIHQKISELVIKSGDSEIKITMTFGLTEFDFSKAPDRTIKKADDNLYFGKKSGRNRIIY